MDGTGDESILYYPWPYRVQPSYTCIIFLYLLSPVLLILPIQTLMLTYVNTIILLYYPCYCINRLVSTGHYPWVLSMSMLVVLSRSVLLVSIIP